MGKKRKRKKKKVSNRTFLNLVSPWPFSGKYCIFGRIPVVRLKIPPQILAKTCNSKMLNIHMSGSFAFMHCYALIYIWTHFIAMLTFNKLLLSHSFSLARCIYCCWQLTLHVHVGWMQQHIALMSQRYFLWDSMRCYCCCYSAMYQNTRLPRPTGNGRMSVIEAARVTLLFARPGKMKHR